MVGMSSSNQGWNETLARASSTAGVSQGTTCSPAGSLGK